MITSKLQSALRLWIRFGDALGRITSPIFLFIYYFVFFTPIAVLARLLKHNPFAFRTDDKTYWITSKESVSSMRDQF